MNTTISADQLFGYDVIDASGNKLGKVDSVWVDDATNRPEFIAVKTGFLLGKNHLMPIEQGQINGANQTIQVPYSQDQVENGPSFAADADLSPGDEEQIYSYYGIERSTAASPSGYAAGTTGTTGTDTAETGGTGQTITGEREANVPLSEEELQVGKRQVQAGQVRLRKVVRTEHEEVPVELRREDVNIERVPATGDQVSDTAFQEQEIDVPVMREEPVVGKQARATGEVRIGKDVETESRTVGGEVRKEDVEVDEEGDVDTEPNRPS